MASHSQLKYGARLINSYLGNNSTISCCEVLNSLIFPAHEQHHNNSFLCASTIMGQSNIAAGATIGSNHNSRSNDGEIVAGRGFWPGLCVSLKHNSKFATFTILAKADYPAELNIPIPFCLVSNDIHNNTLVVMPGYWFMYNMYALSRNTWKYIDRDRRTEKIQNIEYDYLAPDTVNEIFDGIKILGELLPDKNGCYYTDGFENSNRKALITKLPESVKLFTELIIYYGTTQLLEHAEKNNFSSFEEFKKSISVKITRSTWINVGGQLMKTTDVEKLKTQVKTEKIKDWQGLHDMYRKIGSDYSADKMEHAYTSLLEILNITSKQFTSDTFKNILEKSIKIKEWMCRGIYESREKDYTNPFRKMVYDNKKEMDKVIGKIEDNTFIQQQLAELEATKIKVRDVIKRFHL